MKKIITSKIFRKMLILSFLLTGLAFMIFTKTPPVAAAPGCCVCAEAEAWCLENSGGPNDPYKNVPACMRDLGLGNCWAICIPEPGCP
ncbi:MAG: hypothetical protein JSS81_07565 [Acidobacteria bacterium]|nr:hypothetical protein [Acidobacteriota bacterium]